MTKKTRLFLIIAAAVLVVGLGTGLVASYMGLPAFALGGTTGPDELEFVPADARVIAYANVRDVMNSELRRKIREHHPATDGHNQFRDSTGIDIENDIDEVVACLSDGAKEGEDALVIARGRFDAVRIEGFIREKGGIATEYHGTRLLTSGHPDGKGREVALAFVEPGLVAFGTSKEVREAVDRKRGAGQNITANDEVMGLVRDIDDGNAWAVGRFDAIARRARLPREVESQMPAINWFAASGHVNGGIRGQLRAEARDDAAAQNLRDVVRGFVALAKLQTTTKPELATILDSLQLGGEGKTVSLAFSLPSEVIDMIGALTRSHRGPHGADPDPDVEHDDDDDDDDDEDDEAEPPQPPTPPRPPTPPQPRF